MTVFFALGLVGLALVALSFVASDLLDGAFDILDADWFSSAVVGGFVSAFGFGAAASDAAGLPLLVTLPVGAGAGVVVGYFAWWLTRLLKDGGHDATVSVDDSVGQPAQVVTAIPVDGYGVVRLSIGGHSLQYNAKADVAIEAGDDVRVTEVLSPSAVQVAPVWKLDNGTS